MTQILIKSRMANNNINKLLRQNMAIFGLFEDDSYFPQKAEQACLNDPNTHQGWLIIIPTITLEKDHLDCLNHFNRQKAKNGHI